MPAAPSTCPPRSADGLGDERQQARLVGACSGGLLLHAMPDPESLLRAAGVVKVVEQTWRLDQAGADREQLGPDRRAAPDRARRGAAGPRGRGLVHRPGPLRAPDGRPHDHLGRLPGQSPRHRRPRTVLAARRRSCPGARTWTEAQAAAQGALAGLRGHLAIEPPPDPGLTGTLSEPPAAPLPGGSRLRLAVAAAARDGDQEATAAIVREGARQGLDAAELVAVAEAHWPKPALHRRAFRAGRSWMTTRLRRHRPRRPSAPVIPREGQP